jgi:hypothetical protein
MTAKNAPYPACHRDYFAAKAPGPVTGWLRRVTQPPHIAGPLRVMPVVVNQANEVIFQDYHIRNKVVSAAITPEEKKKN